MDERNSTPEELLAGDTTAVSRLLTRQLPPLHKWARGRLPRWARSIADTADLVQEAVLNTLRRLPALEPQGDRALQAYLRRAVENRISDEFRRIARRGVADALTDVYPDRGPSPFDHAVANDIETRYRDGLARLRHSDRELIVGRVELGYSLEQLTVMTGRVKTDSTRVALVRALARLAREMDRG